MAYYGEIAGLDTNTRAYYQFNGSLADSGPNGYTLTDGGTTAYGAGKIGNQSVTVSTYLSIVNNLGIDGGTISMGAWGKTSAVPTNNGDRYFLLNQRSGTTSTIYDILYEQVSGVLKMEFRRVKAGVAVQGIVYNVTLTTGSWYHIALTYSSSAGITGYLNGKNIGNTGASGNGTGISNIFSVGSTTGGGEKWVGSIDEAIISNRLWPDAEIRRYYDQGLGRLTPQMGI